MPHVPDMDKIKPAEFLCDIVDIHACFPSGMFSNYAFFLLRLLPKRTCTTVTPPPSCSCADQMEEGAHVQYRFVRVSAQPVCESTHLFLGDSSLLPEVAVSESDPLEVDPLERPLREELLPEESLLLEPDVLDDDPDVEEVPEEEEEVPEEEEVSLDEEDGLRLLFRFFLSDFCTSGFCSI